MKRPLILVALLYVVGVLLAGVARAAPMPLLAGAFGVAILALVCPRARPPLLGALTLLAGWANATLHSAVLSANDLRLICGGEPALATIRGTLGETPSLRIFVQDEKESWRTLARIDVTALQLNRQTWQPAAGRVAVTTPELLSWSVRFGTARVPVNLRSRRMTASSQLSLRAAIATCPKTISFRRPYPA